MGPDDIGEFVAHRLKVLREGRGLSLRKLAQRSDLTAEMLSRAERVERIPSLETVARVCQGLGITVAEFFDEAGSSATIKARDSVPMTPELHFREALKALEAGLAALTDRPPAMHRRRRRSKSDA